MRQHVAQVWRPALRSDGIRRPAQLGARVCFTGDQCTIMADRATGRPSTSAEEDDWEGLGSDSEDEMPEMCDTSSSDASDDDDATVRHGGPFTRRRAPSPMRKRGKGTPTSDPQV